MTSIYALRPHPVEFNKVWVNIYDTLNKILSLQAVDRQTWSFSFSDIYFLCVAVPESQCTRLYNSVKECIQSHVQRVLQNLLAMPDESLVAEYHKSWRVFDKGVDYIQSLFSYMNNQLMRERRNAESQLLYADPDDAFVYKEIGMLAFEIWKDDLIVPIKDRLVKLLLELIEMDRRNVDTRVVDIRDVILSFVAVTDRYSSANEILQGIQISPERSRPLIKFYEEIFEEPFLQMTRGYFQILSTVEFADLNCSEYMKKVLQIKEEEQERASRFLHFTSREKVEHLTSEILVEMQKERLDSVCRQMIEHESLADLRNMYYCLKPVPNGFSVLLHELSGFIKSTGISMVINANANNDPNDFVSSLHDCQSRFSSIVKDVFNNESDFIASLDKAMELVVNYRSEERQISKASERVNRFIDSILRKSKVNWSESEMEAKLKMALVIFRYIEDKDVFEKYYSKLFASRLIMNNSASREMEEQMIKKMKEACGYEFTNKLSRMFTDIGLSEELTKEFNEHLDGHDSKTVQSSFLILQSAAWPISSDHSSEQFTLPSELELPMLKFDEFYREKHHGRKLTWINHLANAEVRLNYLDRSYIVTMTVEQYALLLNFENQDQSTIGELAGRSGVSVPMLIKALRGLLDGNVLNCSEQELDENSPILLNLTLSNKRLRFKITAPLSQKSVKETQRVIDTVQQDRKLCIECVIVRIMKARKVMKHSELVNEVVFISMNVEVKEVVNQTKARFLPDISTIKQCISQLIEKLYMQRTDDYEEYQYLA